MLLLVVGACPALLRLRQLYRRVVLAFCLLLLLLLLVHSILRWLEHQPVAAQQVSRVLAQRAAGARRAVVACAAAAAAARVDLRLLLLLLRGWLEPAVV